MRRGLPLLMVFVWAGTAFAASDDRTISAITTSPDNTFDNQLTAVGSDSGIFVELDVSGGAVANDNPDAQGGYRVEYYNSSGNLVRRRTSAEINSDPTGLIRWNGQGDSNVNDTLPYGSYTLRAYSSMRNPTIPISIKGSGTTIDRPGDLHVSSGGILSWTNTGSRLSFNQVTLGDPNTSNPTFLRLVDIPVEIQGATNTDRNYGIAANSANSVFITADTATGYAIAKYNTSTETWTNRYWATAADLSGADDELTGLWIDKNDSIYVATATALVGGGSAVGTRSFVYRIGDSGTTGSQVGISTQSANNADYYDVAVTANQTLIANYSASQVDSTTTALGALTTAVTDIDGTNSRGKSIWATSEGNYYFTNQQTDAFSKYTRTGTLLYTHSDQRIDGATGIAVYQKTSTNETFVIVGAQGSNQIVIYKENTNGDSISYVRTIEDDVNNLSTPIGLAVASESSVFVVNRGNDTVKKFSKDGVFQNLSGAANGKFITGTDASAGLTDTQGFNTPGAIAVDTDGNIYVFDQVSNFIGAAAIKRFSASGVPDATVWYDLDANVPGAAWSGEITMAYFSNGAIYAVSRENDARLFKIDLNKNATWATVARDVLSLAVGPYYNSNAFYNPAVYVYLDNDRLSVYSSDLSTQLAGPLAPANPALPAALNVSQPMLVDNAGEPYFMIDAGAGSYDFQKYQAATADNAVAANGLLTYNFTEGNGATQFNDPRQMIWVDNAGIFKYNPTTTRYEQKIWVNDSANNRLQQMLVEWNDVKEQAITIALSQDTPLVISATVSGDTTASISGTYYAGLTTCTIQINFNKSMQVGSPDTMTVQFKPAGGSFTTVNKVSYSGTTWTGTTAITSSMADGEAIIKVTDAYDGDGTRKFIDPNPDQTDFDAADDFKPFVIDKTAPVFTVSAPASSGDSTSAATYTVTGQVTSEATGLDATIQIINWDALTGGSQFDSVTTTALAANGNFEGILDLRAPAPTNNYIEVVAVDRLGNRATLSPRRLIERVKNAGSAFIDPSDELVVGAARRYQITYTAAQDLSNDTLRITIPSAWSAPQKTSATTNGYVTIVDSTSYTDSVISGQAITLTGVARNIGQTMRVIYGDSVSSTSGFAKSTLDAPLDNVSNTYRVELMLAGETTFTNVSAEAGKSLIVPLKDSSIAVATRDTGPGSTFAEIGKGEETKVMVVRFYNSNLGAHTHRVSQIILNVESETSAAVAWNNTASKVVLKNTSEAVTFATVTSMSSNGQLTITPSQLTIGQNASRDVEFWVTFSSTASVDTARFLISALSSITAVDSNSGKSIATVEQETGFVNRKTGLYDIVGFAPAETMSIGADTSFSPADVATGQLDVGVMDLIFKNEPPHADTPVNIARVDRVILSVRRADGTGLIPGHVLRGITIKDAGTQTTYGGVDTPSIPSSGDTITIDFSGLDVASNATVTARVYVDIVNETISTSQFRLRLSDTPSVTVKDKTTQATVRVRDDPARAENLPFQSDSITVLRTARATMAAMTLMRTDSTIIRGEMGDVLTTGEQFFVALNYQATANRSALRLIPSDTDLKLEIGGVDKTSEFTIVAPTAKTIASGSQDTVTYTLTQNLGSTTGNLLVYPADTTIDTRPRVFDNHDFTEPDKLRAVLVVPVPTDTVSIAAAPLIETVFSLGTSYANPSETSVPIIRFQVKNNRGTSRNFDSIVVEAISADSLVVNQVRLTHNGTTVATGTLNAFDTVLLTLSPEVSIAAGGTETFVVAFDFASTQVDGDTFDARVPANGLRFHDESNFPSSSFNSSGNGVVEVVATRVTMTPDTQIVAVGSSANITLKAVDAAGNIDNLANVEASSQGHNLQVEVTIAESVSDADVSHAILSTSGMTSVTPTPGYGVFSINGNLVAGQGTVTIRDTEAAVVGCTIASTLTDSTGAIQYTQSITAAAATLVTSDSAFPDSRGVAVLAVTVTNQSGVIDTITRIGVTSLSTADTNIRAVILFRDTSGNGNIDSGTDKTIANGTFSSGFLSFSGLSETVANGGSVTFLIGYDMQTTVEDGYVIDARADTVDATLGGALVSTALNSTPNRRTEVKALKIAISPQSSTTGTNSSLTVNVSARDTHGNLDKDYNGGATKVEFDVSLSAQFSASTMANQELPVGTDYGKIKGNLVAGAATLTFTDAAVETPVLSVTASPGLTLSNHDTGVYIFEQGFIVTALSLGSTERRPGDTNAVLLAFRVSATGTSDSVTLVKVNYIGKSTADVSNLRLYKDVDDNELFSASSDALFHTAQTFTAETVAFSDTVYVANGTTKAFFFVVDIPTSAGEGDTLDARLLQGSISTQSAISNVPSGIRNSSGNDTVLNPVITGESYALTSETFPAGRKNIVIGSFYFRNGKSSTDTIATIVIKNDGTHPDTGIENVRLFIDSNKSGRFENGTDAVYATAGKFVSGSMTKSGAQGIATFDTVGVLVVVDLSETLAVDQFTLRARTEIGGVTMLSGDTSATKILRSGGTIRVGAQLAAGADSVLIEGGSGVADNSDLATVSVTVRDTGGVPATNRSVTLTGDVGAPITLVASNPQTTNSSGVALFTMRTGTAGTYTFSATIDGVAANDAAQVTFTATNLSSGINLGGSPSSNTLKTSQTGSGKVFIGSVTLDGADEALFIRADGTNWQLVKNISGVNTALLSMNAAVGSETGQVSPISATRIATTNTALGNAEFAFVSVVHRANGLRSQIYAVDLTTGDSTRITGNNPVSTTNAPFTSQAFRWFDVHPSGDSIVTVLDGNLMAYWKTPGNAWDVTADSNKLRYLTAFTNIWGTDANDPGNTDVYAAYPTWSPDGTRIAFSLADVSDNFASGPAVTGADIYVLKNFGNVTYGGYPALTPAPTLTDTSQSYFVRITARDGFAFNPRWTRDGSGIVYSVAKGPDWDWQRLFKGYPHTTGAFDTSNFVTRFVYYDKTNETAPYAPIDISTESFAGSGSLDIAMSMSGQQRFMFVRKSKSGSDRTFELRSVDLASEATITTQGGVIFDSGRIVVVIPSSESYAQGFKISASTPDTTPAAADSVITTGAAKNFYAPGDTTKPFYFADTITIFLYYSREDFTETELVGYDSDGDGIPDRTEAAISAYYYNGNSWIDYNAVRYPAENKIEFKTRHFSLYAVGLTEQARALALGGSVSEIVAYPNPWRADGPTASFASSDERYGIKLTNVPGPDVRIRIYTIAGELVVDGTVNALNRTSTVPSLRVTQTIINTTADGTVSWNLQNQSGRNVASGTYLMVLDGPGGRAVRKVAVIK